MTYALDRRKFIGGASVLAAAGMLGIMAGCSPNGQASAAKEEAKQQSAPDETREYDIAIVGAGAAGLAACVDAAQQGAKVVCIEQNPQAGGNCTGVEGCFGINSSMQKELGVDADPGSTIRMELQASQLKASGPGYVDMVHASGENIDWLVENGVKFGGVDADKGDLMVFHRFETSSGQDSYVVPMAAKAEELGVEFMYGSKARSLVYEEGGPVTGVIVEADKSVIQINAKAVMLATGGFADNEEFMAEAGLDETKRKQGGVPGHDGSGHIMAVEAGAKSCRDHAAFLVADFVQGLPGYYEDGKWCFMIGVAAPYALWINENGERFINEDCPATNIMLMFVPCLRNKSTHVVMDSAMLEQYMAGDDETQKQLDQGIKSGEIVKADTLEELAKAAGFDAKTFASTVEEYNGFSEAGSDHNYGKDPSMLMPLAQAPFYAIRIVGEVNTSIGSISTDRTFHAVDSNDEPIEGLYVIGVEGAMLWSDVYTINVSGGCNANNVNSARTAVRNAVETLL